MAWPTFAAGDDLAFFGSGSVALWVVGPVGVRVAGVLAEQGEHAEDISLVCRLKF